MRWYLIYVYLDYKSPLKDRIYIRIVREALVLSAVKTNCKIVSMSFSKDGRFVMFFCFILGFENIIWDMWSLEKERNLKLWSKIKRHFISRTPINYLLVNLAFADIMVALFIAPQFVLIHTFQHPDGVVGSFLCKFLTGGNLMWTGATASAFSLVAIAFERYFAVIYPYSNAGKLTHGKLKVSMLFSV